MAFVFPDAISEWWCYPTVTDMGNGKVRFGAISSTGRILACEVDRRTGNHTRIELATALVDDHNAPALWTAPGRRVVVAWTQHSGSSDKVSLRVGDAGGTLSGFGPQIDLTLQAGVSYTQIHRVDTDGEMDRFWMFNRCTNEWRLTPFTVNQTTGAVTFEATRTVFSSSSTIYIMSAPGPDDTLRVVQGYNPANTVHNAVRWFDINLGSGDVTCPQDPSVNANVLTQDDLPIAVESVAPLLAPLPAGWSRRLFYPRPGPASRAVAYAEWDNSNPDAATYYTYTEGESGWTVRSYGVAGPRVGYNATANYISGMSFPNPAVDDTVYVARYSAGRGLIEMFNSSGRRILESSTAAHLIRPMSAIGDPEYVVAWSVHSYPSYLDYQAEGLVGAGTAPATSWVLRSGALRSAEVK